MEFTELDLADGKGFNRTIVVFVPRTDLMLLTLSLTVESLQRVRFTMSRQPPGVEQAILAEFINQGHLERFVRTTLRTYRERQAALVDAINTHAKGLLETSPSGTGMYLVAWLNPGVDDQTAARAAAAHGVDVIPLSTFCMEPLIAPGVCAWLQLLRIASYRLGCETVICCAVGGQSLIFDDGPVLCVCNWYL